MEFDEYATARWARLVRACILLGAGVEEAEDLAQATLTKVWRSWRRVQRADDVHFTATADTGERAEELLATIRRTPGHVGLMGPADHQRYDLSSSEKSVGALAEAYVDHLRSQGLEPEPAPRWAWDLRGCPCPRRVCPAERPSAKGSP